MATELTVDGHTFGQVGIDFLAERLAELHSVSRTEIWLAHSGGTSLCMLKSDDRAMLMLLRFEDDPGLVSRATDQSPHGMRQFTLANGQVDEYPADWTVTFDEGRRALEHFWFGGTAAPFITWHDNSA